MKNHDICHGLCSVGADLGHAGAWESIGGIIADMGACALITIEFVSW